jgi:hypothetical protein
MYYPNHIEDICYEPEHIQKVWTIIQPNIRNYFQNYINTEGKTDGVTDAAIAKLSEAFGALAKPKSKPKNSKTVLGNILQQAIDDFEKDRYSYQEHLDLEALAEYKDDVNFFKNTVLKHQIPVIRKTLQNKQAKELDKFRSSFSQSAPGNLFNVVQKIITETENWRSDWYDVSAFEKIDKLDELDYNELDGDDYTAFGVIGGGIKSHFIYKLHPEMYPNRSREAIWSLWYLSDKKQFGCKEDSEFLMINLDESTTQQNYFYPYGLFSFYALLVYKELKDRYAAYGIALPVAYRFVPVDHFLSFVSRQYQSEIDTLKSSAKNYHYDF